MKTRLRIYDSIPVGDLLSRRPTWQAAIWRCWAKMIEAIVTLKALATTYPDLVEISIDLGDIYRKTDQLRRLRAGL